MILAHCLKKKVENTKVIVESLLYVLDFIQFAPDSTFFNKEDVGTPKEVVRSVNFLFTWLKTCYEKALEDRLYEDCLTVDDDSLVCV